MWKWKSTADMKNMLNIWMDFTPTFDLDFGFSMVDFNFNMHMDLISFSDGRFWNFYTRFDSIFWKKSWFQITSDF